MKRIFLLMLIVLLSVSVAFAGPVIQGSSVGAGDVTAATNNQTWGDGTGPVVWTYGVTGTDPVLTMSASDFGLGGNATIGTTTTGRNLTVNATLGTEMVTTPLNGSGWSGTDGWSVNGSAQIVRAGGTTTGTMTAVSGMTAPTTGVTYKVTIVCSAAANSPTYTLGGVTGTTITATTITDYITAATTAKIILSGGATATATIDSVSVKALTDATGDLTVYGNLKVASPIQNIKGQDVITISPLGYLGLFKAPTASANYGTLSIGSGAFDGSTTGKFVGSSSGTSIAVNEVTGYGGNLMDLQKAGVSQFLISPAGVVTAVGDLIISGGDLTLGAASGTVKGTITFYGDTSGTAVLSAPDVAGTATAIVLPATAGTLQLTTGSIAANTVPSMATGDLLYASSGSAIGRVAAGTAYQVLQMNSGATAPEFTSTLSLSNLNLGAATSSIPWPVGTASAPTTEGSAYWNSTTDILTIGDGAAAKTLVKGAGTVTTNTLMKHSGTTGALAAASTVVEDGTDINAQALNFATTGIISGKIGVISKSSAYTLGADAAREAYGYMMIGTGAMVLTLPAGAIGMSVCAMERDVSEALSVKPASGEQIVLNGALLDANHKVTSASGAGDYICMSFLESGKWYTLGRSGTWTDGAE